MMMKKNNEYERRLLATNSSLRIARSGPPLYFDTWMEWHRLGWTGWAGCELGLSLYTRFLRAALANLSAREYFFLISLISIFFLLYGKTIHGKIVEISPGPGGQVSCFGIG